MTILLVDLPVEPGGARDQGWWEWIDEVVDAAGGTVFERAVDLVNASRPGAVVLAAFHIAADAAHAAVRLGDVPVASHPWRGPRLALATGEVAQQGDGYDGPAVDRARQLAALPVEATILVAATTAVMLSPTLPQGAELVDLGGLAVTEHRSERVHHLRLPISGREGGPADDTGASNLGWARRAAVGPVVGRDGPVELLEGAWERARGGEHRMVVI